MDMLVCTECRLVNEHHDNYECDKCGECLDYARPHCHDKELKCIPFISKPEKKKV